jgi:DNA ligase (NAD+)
VQNLLDGIEGSKEKPYVRVLFALGIRHVGSTVARILAERFASIDALMKASQEELEETNEVGPKIAESVRYFFEDKAHVKMIERLRKAGVKFAAEKTTKKGALSGKSFVITGTLDKYSRDEAKDLIEEAGGVVASSVSKSVSVLVVGENAGSKLDKAKALGIETWDEKKLLKELGKQ